MAPLPPSARPHAYERIQPHPYHSILCLSLALACAGARHDDPRRPAAWIGCIHWMHSTLIALAYNLQAQDMTMPVVQQMPAQHTTTTQLLLLVHLHVNHKLRPSGMHATYDSLCLQSAGVRHDDACSTAACGCQRCTQQSLCCRCLRICMLMTRSTHSGCIQPMAPLRHSCLCWT